MSCPSVTYDDRIQRRYARTASIDSTPTMATTIIASMSVNPRERLYERIQQTE